MNFGSLLRATRQSRDISVKQAAAAIDYSPQYFSQVEEGKVKPLRDILTLLMPLIQFTPEEYLALYYAKEQELNE